MSVDEGVYSDEGMCLEGGGEGVGGGGGGGVGGDWKGPMCFCGPLSLTVLK